jgi:hypothetical protein
MQAQVLSRRCDAVCHLDLLAVGWLVACRWRNRALSAANDVVLFSFGALLVAPRVRTTLSGTEVVVVIAAKVSPMQEFCIVTA